MLLLWFTIFAMATPSQSASDKLFSGKGGATPISRETWITEDDYPFDAWVEGRSGIVGFKVTVDQIGRAVTCNVTQSSGFNDLDKHTCEVYRLRAKFSPATDDQGRPTLGEYVDRVKWQLPSEGAVKVVTGVDSPDIPGISKSTNYDYRCAKLSSLLLSMPKSSGTVPTAISAFYIGKIIGRENSETIQKLAGQPITFATVNDLKNFMNLCSAKAEEERLKLDRLSENVKP